MLKTFGIIYLIVALFVFLFLLHSQLGNRDLRDAANKLGWTWEIVGESLLLSLLWPLLIFYL